MITFNEWLIANHSEILEEGWWQNTVAGAAIGAAGMGLGGYMSQSKPVQPKVNQSQNMQQPQNMQQNQPEINRIKQLITKKGTKGWNDKLGNYEAWEDGNQYIFQSEDGNFYKPFKSKFAQSGEMWQKLDLHTGKWERPTTITDYMRIKNGK